MSSAAALRAIDPATGETLEPGYALADASEVARACAAAAAAFDAYRETSLEVRAAFLERIGANIEALGDALIERAARESGLPVARLTGERGRTVGQLKLFAETVHKGEWQDVRIEPADEARQPLRRPDLRLRQIALGPVAVFGASNFPLAFSVAGGDTASALAAGCPVVVKGHPAHPGTGAMVADAIARAVSETGMPEGTFGYVLGEVETGTALVRDPRIKAVGFTGSRRGGLALLAAAQARPEPIPVYAEMSSINPVLLMPAALAARGEAIAEGYIASLTMGAGQFCTNPGLVLAIGGEALDRFVARAAELVGGAAAQVMLTPGIHRAFEHGVAALGGHADVVTQARGVAADGHRGQAGLFETDAKAFLADPALAEEVFGAASLVVRCADEAELAAVIESLEGQLTATLQIDAGDEAAARRVLPLLERKVGRILVNGWPTGVEVSPAMVHGGPFPATSDSRTTSVGTLAIRRFLRPVAYQDFPAGLLPEVLR